jgi:hypothetical protein
MENRTEEALLLNNSVHQSQFAWETPTWRILRPEWLTECLATGGRRHFEFDSVSYKFNNSSISIISLRSCSLSGAKARCYEQCRLRVGSPESSYNIDLQIAQTDRQTTASHNLAGGCGGKSSRILLSCYHESFFLIKSGGEGQNGG